MKLVYTHSAQRDILRLRKFIAIKNPPAAKKHSMALLKSIKQLTQHPRLGAAVEEIDSPETREYVANAYIVRYAVSKTQVSILAVWHEKEDR